MAVVISRSSNQSLQLSSPLLQRSMLDEFAHPSTGLRELHGFLELDQARLTAGKQLLNVVDRELGY
ncbi:MAG TPA: hypothetical protein VM910_28280 [Bradyrhizobium sp.]|nr:hypothetical protein [Bradyrhizobium sp.]